MGYIASLPPRPRWVLEKRLWGNITVLEEHEGVLYGASDGSFKLVKREGGVWSEVCAYPTGSPGYWSYSCNGMASFGGVLYVSFTASYGASFIWAVCRLDGGALVVEKSAPGALADFWGNLFILNGLLFYSGATGSNPSNKKNMFRYDSPGVWTNELTTATAYDMLHIQPFDGVVHSYEGYWVRGASPPIALTPQTSPVYRIACEFGGRLYGGGGAATLKYKSTGTGSWTDVTGELTGWELRGGAASEDSDANYLYLHSYRTAGGQYGIIKYDGAEFTVDKIFGISLNKATALKFFGGDLFVALYNGQIWRKENA